MIPRTRWAKTVDGANIAYQDLGEGEITLVLIHGWISHLEVYWEQPRFARFMRRLSTNMRVLHFDKRGTGMSDRFAGPPDLEARMDDVRAVMDAAGVERAAIFGWGSGGPMLALPFAATHPERTIALCVAGMYGSLCGRASTDFPWGWTDEELDRDIAAITAVWGDADNALEFVYQGFGDRVGAAPFEDQSFLQWCAKFARFAATPGSYEAFERMWFETDVRNVLPVVSVPTLALYKSDGYPEFEAMATYIAERIPGAQVAKVEGAGDVVWMDEPDSYVTIVERFLSSVSEEERELDRVLATVLFTDIVGSSARAAELGDRGWKTLVERHHTIVRAMLGRFRGIEVDTAGDGFFASFDGPARAVRCAKAIVDAVKPLQLEIRAGIHTGEVERIDDKIGGIAVTIGARVGAMADPSEILVSQTVRDLVAGSGLKFEDRGSHELKGVPDRWQLYRLAE